MKAVDIEVMVVDKVVCNVLVDGGNGLNILPKYTMKKLGFSVSPNWVLTCVLMFVSC